MSSEFYRRTKDLFEEFQNRELHYLKLEKISDFQLANDKSLPVEEYLQKLNQKEKETEETYRDLMNHMELLDRRTDSISKKLEKLHLLRTTITSKPPSWFSTNHSLDKFNFSSSYNPSTNALPTDFKYTSGNITEIPLTILRSSIKHAATQTDYIFCEKCYFPLAQSHVIANLPISIDESLTKAQSQSKNTVSQTNEPSVVTDYKYEQTNSSSLKNATVSSSSENIEPKNIFLDTEDAPRLDNRVEFVKDINVSSDNNAVSIIRLEENLNQNATQESTDLPMLSDKNDFVKENSLPLKNDLPVGDNLEKTISKSDDGSLTQEFDFLESDKMSQTLKTDTEKLSDFSVINDQSNKVIEPNTQAVNNEISNYIQEKTVNDATGVQKSNLELHTSVRDNFGTANVDDANDNKSESSVSIRARSPSLLSENVSAVSDSDSFYEKEEPQLSATAAYQALLGNISVSKNIKTSVPYSETESEDEVERALATATKKNSNILISTPVVTEEKANGEKKFVQETKAKPEPRKSISIPSKPQQLSKKTRKVLGLDTSSASEEDLQSKVTTAKKIDEDSDEFDFYD